MAIVAAGLQIAFISLMVPWLINMLSDVLGGFLYSIAQGLFWMIDILQDVFRKLAGLESVYISGTNNQSNDVILSLLTNAKVVEIIITMTLFAVALLIIATIVQLIRVEYTTEGAKNSKSGILGIAIKSFAMFILVPVVCMVGIGVSNVLLKAVDRATSQGGSTSISGTIFLAGSANANVIRKGEREWVKGDGFLSGGTDERYKITDKGTFEMEDSDGQIIKVNVGELLGVGEAGDDDANRASLANGIDSSFGSSKDECIKILDSDGNVDLKLSYDDKTAVTYCYNLGEIDYLTLFLACGFALTTLFKSAFGLIMRLYKVVALFIISPGVIALQPLDGGNAYKLWRKNFLGAVLGAYGVIVSLNLFFFLIGVLKNIQLFPTDVGGADAFTQANYWVSTIIMLVGLLMINDLAKTISGYIGGEDVLSSGASMAGNVGKLATKVGSTMTKGALMAGGLASGALGIGAKLALNKDNKRVETAKANAKDEFLNGRDEKDLTDDEKKELAHKMNSAGADASKMSNNKRKFATMVASKGARGMGRFKQLASDGFNNSSIVSFANKLTGGYSKSLGGKAMAGLDEDVTKNFVDDEIMGMASQGDGLITKGAESIINKVKGVRGVRWTTNDTLKSNVETMNAASATAQSSAGTKEYMNSVDRYASLNADMMQYVNLTGQLKDINIKDPEGKKKAQEIVKALQDISKKMGGENQETRDDELQTLAGRIDNGSESNKIITKLNTMSEVVEFKAKKAEIDTAFEKVMDEIDKAQKKYVKGVTDKTLKDAMKAFDNVSGASSQAEFESIAKKQAEEIQKKVDKAAEKAATKASNEALAKMIAKFSKK